MGAVVLVAFLFVLPVLLAVLGATAVGHDKLMAWIMFGVVVAFAMVVWIARLEPRSLRIEAFATLDIAGLWLSAAVGLGMRLARDRNRRHLRGTLESLAVLGSGAILLAALLSLPIWFAGA